MKKKGCLWAALAAMMMTSAGQAANSVLTVGALSQNTGTRRVTVPYTLSGTEPMIVTLDILTNGTVSVGGRHLRNLAGSVNRLVQPGTHEIYWFPNKEFPAVETLSVKAKVTAWHPSTPPDYMVVNLLTSESGRVYQYFTDIEAIPFGCDHPDYKKTKMIFRRIPSAGVIFRMGSVAETGRDAAREVPHLVTFTHDYWMAIYQMTVGQYNALANKIQYAGADYDLPKYLSGWGETRGAEYPHDPAPGSIIEKFRSATGLTNADAPTDALYEFAHRAGVEGPICIAGYTYNTDSAKVYWYGQTAAHPVGLLEPNAWDLYDMAGNGTTRCLDAYTGGDDFRATFGANYMTEPVSNPLVSSGNGHHVIRGSRYDAGVADTRPAHRFWDQWNGGHNAVRFTIQFD